MLKDSLQRALHAYHSTNKHYSESFLVLPQIKCQEMNFFVH